MNNGEQMVCLNCALDHNRKISVKATDWPLIFFMCSDNSLIRVDRLEYHIREELNKTASRTMVVMHPLKVWHSVPAANHSMSSVFRSSQHTYSAPLC
jgi:hypothetical protein